MKDKSNNQDEQGPAVFSAAEEGMIHSRFTALNERMGLERETPSYALSTFQRKLEITGKGSGSVRSFGWRSFFLAIVSSLSIGVIVTRAALMPSIETARGSTQIIEMKGDSVTYQLLKLQVDDPVAVGRSAAVAAVSAGLAVRTEESSADFKLAVQGLSSFSPDHSKLKKILEISPSAQGDIYVVLSKR